MDTVREKAIGVKDPARRQVLVNIGNRYVVFGNHRGLPGERVLGPNDVLRPVAERIADEYDFPASRLEKSIVVDGADIRLSAGADPGWDFEVIYPDGSTSIVEIKIRTRDFTLRELDQNIARLRQMQASGFAAPEIWNFNIDRLNLHILAIDGNGSPHSEVLPPLNVWQYNQDGSTFDRAAIENRVTDWVKRIDNLYASIAAWSAGLGVTIDRSRTIRMSEELMQDYAVPDRDLSILDLSKNGKATLSFVPVGLWIFGSNGRIDIISNRGTTLLLDLARPLDPPNWCILKDRVERSFEPWGKAAFLEIFEAAEAT
ncbi:hypothetical protein [Rhodopseudomonas sp. AAP120]|uniref:hypothetical protein n=1 Tax=Rhodopseudomonas sp. AAP120 TaxID=1523430 RepID=UPI000A6DD29D|nr:hypothetical protein [Rhodopseudomonas sp. AAP120]